MNAMTTVNCIKKDTTYSNDTVTKCEYVLGSLVPRALHFLQKELQERDRNEINFWE